MSTSYRLLVKNLRQVVQVTDRSDVHFLTGQEQGKIKVLESEKNDLAILVDKDGKIAHVGLENEIRRLLVPNNLKEVDAQGGTAVPGLVDAHTHPVFAGDRVHEFAMKLAGATYLEVQAAGGGIHFSTTATRAASEDELLGTFLERVAEMLRSGTTTLEAKSGYGLDTQSELKMLQVLDTATSIQPVEISATFCGGHAVPRGSTEASHTKLICSEMIPAIQAEKLTGRLKAIENIDVFCEKGVIEVENTEKILKAGQKIGLAINFHAEELHQIGGAEMGARIGARAMSHLEEVSDGGICEMAKAGTVAVLLPTTAYILRLKPPPARKMIEAGIPVALGSDFNPNAWCSAMPTVAHLACVLMKLTMPEALVAMTLNAAHSLGRGATHGALSVGRKADILILAAPSWEHLIYRLAGHSSVIRHVIKNGDVVHSNPNF